MTPKRALGLDPGKVWTVAPSPGSYGELNGMTKVLLTTAFFVRHDHVKPAEQIGESGRTN